MGNSEHINELDPKKIKDVISIGVCRIGLKYDPDVLLWTENVNWTGRGDKESYRKILIDTKSPVKICREHWESLKIPEDSKYSFFQYGVVEGFGHNRPPFVRFTEHVRLRHGDVLKDDFAELVHANSRDDFALDAGALGIHEE